MRIKVDWDRCNSHGICIGEAPEVFALTDEGQLDVLQEEPPEPLRASVESAARFCPTAAITIED